LDAATEQNFLDAVSAFLGALAGKYSRYLEAIQTYGYVSSSFFADKIILMAVFCLVIFVSQTSSSMPCIIFLFAGLHH
jgi:hypothetical protein